MLNFLVLNPRSSSFRPFRRRVFSLQPPTHQRLELETALGTGTTCYDSDKVCFKTFQAAANNLPTKKPSSDQLWDEEEAQTFHEAADQLGSDFVKMQVCSRVLSFFHLLICLLRLEDDPIT